MTTDPLPPAAGAECLTAALHKSGVLGAVCACNVTLVSSLKKLRSHTFRLRLQYEGPAAGAPVALILKMGHLDGTGRSSYANRREIAFYRDVVPASPAGGVPRCLLEDLTDSHFIATEWPLPPTLEQYESIVQALAHFHGAWWDDPRLGVSVGGYVDSSDQIQQTLVDQFARFTDRYGEILSPERRDLYEKLFDRAPRLLARHQTHRNLTLIHGDAHPWNFFLPRVGIGAGVRLIDWEGWSIDTATDDLAYMMAMLWYTDRRHRMERPLLDLYHATLSTHGVGGYDRQALDDDYRLSTLWLITRPIGQAANNIPARVWWNNLERIMLAVDDLGCRELLD